MVMASAMSTQRVYGLHFCALRPVDLFFLALWCLCVHIQSLWVRIFVMPPRMRVLAQSQGQEQNHVCLKYIEASVTNVVGGMDVDTALLVKLKRIVEERCIARLCSEERGGALTNKHFQMMVEGNFASLLVLNKRTKVCLGWNESSPTGHVISCEK
jgi:hypothetical protein